MKGDLEELIKHLDGGHDHRVLRFSRSDVPGRYRWASIESDSIAIMRALLAVWNKRALVLEALRAYADLGASGGKG